MPSPWILATIALTLVLVATVWFSLRTRAQLREQLGTELASQRNEVAQREALLQEHHHQWQAHVNTVQAGHAEAMSAERAKREGELERIRSWAASSMRWESLSRDLIIRAASEAGLDGFLATNICFRADGTAATFIHQIDHLLVTSNTVMVIESKSWDGLIFHYRKGGGSAVQQRIERLPALRGLPDGKAYVVHLRENHPPTILRSDTDQEPTRQVTRQIMQLKEQLAQIPEAVELAFVEACVFYSHPQSVLVNDESKVDRTRIVDRDRLRQLLGEMRNSTSRVPVEAIGRWAAGHGADVYGLGAFREHWRSVLTLK